MNSFIQQSAKRRRLICEEAQEKLNLPAASLEKDYWVCWILRELFRHSSWGENLTFKGGTSLSKCWNIINRFSEDIDIVIDKGFLGFSGERSPENAPSNKKMKIYLKEMKEAAQEKIHKELFPSLKEQIKSALPVTDDWRLIPASETEDPDRQTLLFEYPTVMTDSEGYIRRDVKIEMGARSENEPGEKIEVHPYLFDAFPEILGPSHFPVRALVAERTFWEKAMLLHEETYRPAGKKRRTVRMARHYYDLWCLITRGIAEKAIDCGDIFSRTAKHREIYFKWSWMDYGTLQKGKLRLIPLPESKLEWRRDYEAMRTEMFFGEVPSFDEVIQVVQAFQDSFNGK